MADKKPLVLDEGAQLQQLQSSDDLNIPLNERVQLLESKLSLLVNILLLNGIELPEELITNEN